VGVSVGGTGRDSRLVSRRGGARSNRALSGGEWATGRRSVAAAARVAACQYRETAHALSSHDGRRARQGSDEYPQCRPASVGANRTDADSRSRAHRPHGGSRTTAGGTLGDMAGTRTARSFAAVANDAHLGQSRRTPELGDRALAARPRGDAAGHATEWQLAQHGGIAATDHQSAGVGGAASADAGRDHRLVRGDGGRMERGTNTICLGRKAARTARAGPPAVDRWLCRLAARASVICGTSPPPQ